MKTTTFPASTSINVAEADRLMEAVDHVFGLPPVTNPPQARKQWRVPIAGLESFLAGRGPLTCAGQHPAVEQAHVAQAQGAQLPVQGPQDDVQHLALGGQLGRPKLNLVRVTVGLDPSRLQHPVQQWLELVRVFALTFEFVWHEWRLLRRAARLNRQLPGGAR